MVDYFSILGVPRHPALDKELLKQKYLELSSQFHPDKSTSGASNEGHEKFTEINEAYKILGNPKTRIMHLLDLVGFTQKEKFQQIDPAIANLFSEVGKVLQQADKLIKERNHASSPMVKAALFGQGIELTDQLQQWQSNVQVRLEHSENAFSEKGTFGEQGYDFPEGEKVRLYQQAVELGFLQRLQQQIGEKIVALSF